MTQVRRYDTGTTVVSLRDHRDARRGLSDNARLSFERRDPEWKNVVMRRLAELVALNRGWDGFDAPPVEFHNAYFSVQMLQSICSVETPAPAIVPGYYGDLQVEWHSAGTHIELHVKGPNRVEAWRSTDETGVEGEEIDLSTDFTIVAKWLADLTRAFRDDDRARA